MERIAIHLQDESYPFYYGYDCLDLICERLLELDSDLFVLVTDRHMAAGPYACEVEVRLARSVRVLRVTLEPGETSKSLERLVEAAEEAVAAGASRRTLVVTLGGGIPGNFGGLLAALLFRGIRLVHVPTTLVGMFDSVVSLKQAVNSRHGKNLFGTFHCPTMVLADLKTLETLPLAEVRSGLCEVIKNALAIDPEQIGRLRSLLRRSAGYDPEEYRWLLMASLEAKLRVMAIDKHEKRTGLILEYGHTVGHAIELAHQRRCPESAISHGEAVGLGMLAAAQIASALGVLDRRAAETHWELLDRIGARQTLPAEISGEDVLALVAYDNKRGYRPVDPGVVNMILLRALGEALGSAELPLTPVPIDRLQSALEPLVVRPLHAGLGAETERSC
jgi:3-dehydroquinate synthase